MHAYTYICMLREHKYILIIQLSKLMALPNSKYLKVIDIFSEIFRVQHQLVIIDFITYLIYIYIYIDIYNYTRDSF